LDLLVLAAFFALSVGSLEAEGSQPPLRHETKHTLAAGVRRRKEQEKQEH
jgi:hypothetical protein